MVVWLEDPRLVVVSEIVTEVVVLDTFVVVNASSLVELVAFEKYCDLLLDAVVKFVLTSEFEPYCEAVEARSVVLVALASRE